ncbi:MAG: hypothetical protein IOC52_13005 [Methylobacterium sp.]|nr:hypothetical protein [Methylobacterium sp.]
MRTFNILAIATLIGSATTAYSVKYETILMAEKLKKRQTELQREKDAIAVLKAEWQILNRPTRLQALAPPEAGMQQLSARQILRAGEVPQRGAEVDPLESMLTGSVNAKPATTPVKTQGRPATTPSTVSRPGAPRPATTPQKSVQAPQRPASGAPLALRPPAPPESTRDLPRAEALAAPVPRRNVTPTPR